MSYRKNFESKKAELAIKIGTIPNENFFFAFEKASPLTKAFVFFIIGNPELYLPFFQKPFLIVFTPEEIILMKDFGSHKVTKISKQSIVHFKVSESFGNFGVGPKQITIEIESRDSSFSFFTFECVTVHSPYYSENISFLDSNNWYGYLKN